MFTQREKSFTWWDYRMNGFKRTSACDRPYPVSPELALRCRASSDRHRATATGASIDHAPVMAERQL